MGAKLQQRLHTGAQWALVAGFLFFPVFLALGNIAIALAAVLALLAGGWRQRWQQIGSTPLLWWALGLYGCVLLGVAYSPAPWADMQVHLSKYGKLLALPLLWPALRGLFEFGPLGLREWAAALLAAVTVWPVARGLRPLGRPLSAAGALPCGAAR